MNPSPYLYAGIDPDVWQTLRHGLLARGQAEPQRLAGPADVSVAALVGVSHLFVDGPASRLQGVLDTIDTAGLGVPVVWIATDESRRAASPELLARVLEVWDWPAPQIAWLLPDEWVPQTLPESVLVAPDGIGPDEGARLAHLESGDYGTLGHSAQLQRFTDWVTAYFGFPIAFVNLVGRDMQSSLAQSGLPDDMVIEMPREMAFCQFVVAGNQPVLIPDIPQSQVFQDVGLAAMIGMQAYAGVPIVSGNELVMGSLCMVDTEPHAVTLTQVEVLSAVAAGVSEALHAPNPRDGRLQVSRPVFQRWVHAVLQDAQASERPLCLARLPGVAAEAAWAEGLDFITVTEDGDCLACLPQTTRASGEPRMVALLAALGDAGRPTLIEAGIGKPKPWLSAALDTLLGLGQGAF
ncbi:MAG: GAF domain-containing protein [Candidatus Sericytochromatia bacterium]|nr:GAF domain-containing protein [Candidatus Sericytochromatia bacterium]